MHRYIGISITLFETTLALSLLSPGSSVITVYSFLKFALCSILKSIVGRLCLGQPRAVS